MARATLSLLGTGTARLLRPCGSGLFGEPDGVAGMGIALASIHGPIDREPELHIFWAERAPWVCVGDDLPRLGGRTGYEPVP